MTTLVERPRRSRQSIRTRLIVGTVLSLTIVLGLFGLFVRYVVATTLIASVDRELSERLNQFQHRPPPGVPGGPPPFGGQGPPPGHGGPASDWPGNPMFADNGPTWPSNYQPGQAPENNGAPQGPQPQFDDHGNIGPYRPAPFGPISGGGRRGPNDPYRVRRFDSAGNALDEDDHIKAWDLLSIKKAAKNYEILLATVRYDGADLRVAVQQFKSPYAQDTSFIETAYPLTATEAAIGGVDKALLILIPIALLIAAAGGALVTTSVLKRVRQMVQTAAKIGANDLSQRLAVVGRDEFADLAETFNGLLARVDYAFQEQQRIVEQQRRFTADASHELKTPLTVIRGTTSLALAGNGILDHQSTVDIDCAAASMSDLVQDLIYLARSDTGQLGKERIDILLVEPLQMAIKRIAAISDVPIRFVDAREDLIVNANQGELMRLFSNIINNAAHHTPPDGRIIISLSSTSNEAVILVNDSGVGIAPQHIEHLGERFYRADSSRTRSSEGGGGSGLGLAICLGIVQAHHGTMSIDSLLGKGTTVTITLPRVASDQS
jgi:signal transduction histidine kinase